MESTTIYTCEFCSKECKNNNSKSQHVIRCKSNPNRIINKNEDTAKCSFCDKEFKFSRTKFHENYCKLNSNRKEKLNQYTKAEKLGLPKPEISEETRQKISINSKSTRWTDEQKANHSIAMKKAVLANPESYSKSNRGRVKHIKKYNMTFDGSWELKFFEWCLNNNVKAIDNKEFYEYKWNGNLHLYNPDFYIESLDIFVEVKGFYDDRDLCKWTDFPKKLFILDASKIKLIDSNIFKIEYIAENKKDFS